MTPGKDWKEALRARADGHSALGYFIRIWDFQRADNQPLGKEQSSITADQTGKLTPTWTESH